jgi:ribulose 1,5-bisphosphate carboxylase large subunit-like protein
MTQDREAIVNKIFNRLRARLFNMIEQIGLSERQTQSCKQSIKDITSNAWNDIKEIEKSEE